MTKTNETYINAQLLNAQGTPIAAGGKPRPYHEWVELSRRWQAAVDFGSPISAWTLDMLEEARKAREEGRQDGG